MLQSIISCNIVGIKLKYTSLETVITSRGGAVVARQAHNLEVIGSNPFPATIELTS